MRALLVCLDSRSSYPSCWSFGANVRLLERDPFNSRPLASSTPPPPPAALRATACAPTQCPSRSWANGSIPCHVERGPPATLVILSQLKVEALAVHPHSDVSNPSPRVQPRAERVEGAVVGGQRESGEPEHGLLDNLIRPSEHWRRDLQTELLRRLEVDHQFELAWLLDGKVRGLGAFEDLVHIDGGTPIQIGKARSIRHETPHFHELPPSVHRRNAQLRRQFNDSLPPAREYSVATHEQSAGVLALDRSKYGVDLAQIPCFKHSQPHAERLGGCFHTPSLTRRLRRTVCRRARIPEESRGSDCRERLLENL